MALEKLSHKTSTGATYAYVHAAPQSRTYLLFCHGFPETSFDWTNQTTHFVKEGYGIIAPDLLGYGGTDKPADKEAYRLKKMAEEVVSILDKHGVQKCVAIGHDWGVGILNALNWHFHDRVAAFAFLATGYSPPGGINVDAMNKTTEELLGYPAAGYWHFFNSPDSDALIAKNQASMASLLFGSLEQHWQKHLCPYGAARAWIENNKTCPLHAWVTDEQLATFNDNFMKGGWNGPVSWYRQIMQGVNDRDDATVSEDRKGIPDIPVLFVATYGVQDIVPPSFMEAGMKQACRDLTIVPTHAGHWLMWEDPEGVNKALDDFLKKLEVK